MIGPPDGLVLPGLSRLVTRSFFSLSARVEVYGREHVPRAGPLVVVVNHLHLADPPLLIATTPRDLALMAKSELFQVPLIGGIIRLAGAFPVRRGEADRTAIRFALTVLQRGGALVMFPEGTRSKTGVLQEGHRGVALLVHRSGALVQPAGITGTDAFLRFGTAIRRPRIVVRFGEPFRLDFSIQQGDAYRRATGEIMRRIAVLLPPERRGGYA